MKVDGYSSDELKSFHRVLQAAMAEISARRADFQISDMIGRLFEAADKGERDPVKLKAAVLALTQVRALAASKKTKNRNRSMITIAPRQHSNQPMLTVFPRARLSTQKS
jgi:hypothetical protein